MLPRNKLDIGWSDLLFGIARCFQPGNRAVVQKRVEEFWSPDGDAVACLSVRTAFDLLLHALAWPPGTEILVSALTIRDMIRVVEAHGLVPVPIDIGMDSLSVKTQTLSAVVSGATKGMLVAHLFGSRMPLDEMAAIAQKLGLYLIEDCAQAYAADGYRGHSCSDSSLFSFGPIKTNTALGGGIMRIQDPTVRARAKAIQATYPIQSRGRFLKRLLQYTVLKSLTYKPMFTGFRTACELLGRSHDQIINGAVRGFPGPDFFQQIRKQASFPLLTLLERRLRESDSKGISMRVSVAETASRLMPQIRRPGVSAQRHTHWIYPVMDESPDELVEYLWQKGFDATRGASNLYAVPSPASHPDSTPKEALNVMEQILYLPVYAGVTDRDLKTLARVITSYKQHQDEPLKSLSPGNAS
jgi:perosamine synthetase